MHYKLDCLLASYPGNHFHGCVDRWAILTKCSFWKLSLKSQDASNAMSIVQVVKLGLNCKWSSFCWLGVYYCRLTHQAVSTLDATCQLPHVWWSMPKVPHRCTVEPPGQSTVFNGAYRSIFCRAIKKMTFHGCYFFYL